MRESPPPAFGESARLEVPADLPPVPASSGPTPLVGAAGWTPEPTPPAAEYDPLRLCIYTTIGVIAWLITPPLTVAVFGSIGVAGYWRARRRGLVSSRCLLGDTRLVIAYLAIAALAGVSWTVWSLVR